MGTAAWAVSSRRFIQAKDVMLLVYGVLMVVVWLTRDRLLLDANSWLRQRYAPVS